MSWKRIFKAARRLGTPIIVADESGKDPLVVMPLSKYEDLVEGDELFENFEDEGFEMGQSMDEELSALDPRLEKVFEDQFVAEMQDLAQQKEKESEMPSVEPIMEAEENRETKQEMPLEDRFYFEPTEDDFKK